MPIIFLDGVEILVGTDSGETTMAIANTDTIGTTDMVGMMMMMMTMMMITGESGKFDSNLFLSYSLW